MLDGQQIREQLIADLEHMHSLIIRYVKGERHLKQARDRLEGAVQVKLALLAGKEEPEDMA